MSSDNFTTTTSKLGLRPAQVHKVGDGFVRQLRVLADVIHPGQRHRKLLVALDESANLCVCKSTDRFIIVLLILILFEQLLSTKWNSYSYDINDIGVHDADARVILRSHRDGR